MSAQLNPATIMTAPAPRFTARARALPAQRGEQSPRAAGDAVVILFQPAADCRNPKLSAPAENEDILKVNAFLAGDETGFEFLFEKYRQKVYGIAYRFVRNREDALEVAQEVFLRVYQGLDKFKTDSKFFTWLYRITVNRSIDFTRSRKSRPLQGMDEPAMEALGKPTARKAPAQSPVEYAGEKELEDKIREAVATLSEKHQLVFILHTSEDLSYKEIAEVAGCNVGTVMSRLFYARKKLQEALVAMGYRLD